MAPLFAIALRLLPGDDLKIALDRFVREEGIGAGCILTCVGSLSGATLRLAEAAETMALAGPLEIVSLTGTLSPDGSHLHLAVADTAGMVTGGHVKEGCPVHTTAEVVVGVLPGTCFTREFDPVTGFRELLIVENTKEVTDAQGE